MAGRRRLRSGLSVWLPDHRGTDGRCFNRAVLAALGSLGEWDLVGIGPTDVVLVQVKTRDWPGTRRAGSAG